VLTSGPNSQVGGKRLRGKTLSQVGDEEDGVTSVAPHDPDMLLVIDANPESKLQAGKKVNGSGRNSHIYNNSEVIQINTNN